MLTEASIEQQMDTHSIGAFGKKGRIESEGGACHQRWACGCRGESEGDPTEDMRWDKWSFWLVHLLADGSIMLL